ncbi:unnamed protein product [Rhizophagus irregularis]|uniref:Uncharacterized protein n=1 Tax=Rhizophagus irregularis TaxID=588596 RepID=A0A2I1GZV2_9GLOM|nr:hypothetical protein RhiirA4_469619 [Rhizophagus irregularis]CAB4420542.1 unnamed protein product [Rhizophagus irregularis]
MGRSRRSLNQNLCKFLKKHNIPYQQNLFNTIHKPLVVSDNTKATESRPYKCNINDPRNSFSLYIDPPTKHPRPAPTIEDDSNTDIVIDEEVLQSLPEDGPIDDQLSQIDDVDKVACRNLGV